MESLRESDSLFVELGQLLSKENLSLFDQVTSEVFFMVNPQDGNCHFISKSAADILGYTNDQLNVSFFLSLIHRDDKNNVLKYYSECAQKDFGPVISDNKRKLNCIDFRIVHKNGSWIWVALNCVLVSNKINGLPKVLFGGIRDITKRKEEELCLMHAIRCTHKTNGDFQPSPELHSEIHQDSFITPREKQILRLIGRGLSSREIADQLFVSSHTVIKHRKNIIAKFKVKNTAQLIREASRLFWI